MLFPISLYYLSYIVESSLLMHNLPSLQKERNVLFYYKQLNFKGENMNFFHNDTVIFAKHFSKNGIHIIYRILETENEQNTLFSLLISASSEENIQDFFISNFSNSKKEAENAAKSMFKNRVLPTEIKYLFSDGTF